MSYKELLLYIKRRADKSSRIFELLLTYWLGKPEERIYVEYRETMIANEKN